MLRACRTDGNGERFTDAAARAALCLLFRHLGDARTSCATPDCLGTAVVLGTHRPADFVFAIGAPALRLTLPCFVPSCCLGHSCNAAIAIPVETVPSRVGLEPLIRREFLYSISKAVQVGPVGRLSV
jgi:hypothetical protein